MSAVSRQALVAAARQAVDEWLEDHPDPKAMTALDDGTVRWAIDVVDSMNVLDEVGQWLEESKAGPGGPRARRVPVRAVLVAFLLAALDGRPMLFDTVTKILFVRISEAMRAQLGVKGPYRTRKEQDASYRAVRTTFWRMVGVMDPSVRPRNRRLPTAEYEARKKDMTPDQIDEAYRRLDRVTNRIIEASIALLPRDVRRKWKGSVSLDATPIPVHSAGRNRELGIESSDPDCAWYIREGDHRDPEVQNAEAKTAGSKSKPVIRKKCWGYEATILVSGPDGPAGPSTFPRITYGLALSRPGVEPGDAAMRVLRSVVERHHPRGYLAVDRAYAPDLKPENFQNPARALGYTLVFDYRKDQLGAMQSAAGAILVEGAWYCPTMPDLLINATADHRAHRIDLDTYRERISARRAFMARAKDELRIMCPAAGACPTAMCQLKPDSFKKAKPGTTKIPVLPAAPDRICSQASATLPQGAGDKYRQDLHYGSDQWHSTYTILRQGVEGYNGTAKSPERANLASAKNRRARGIAAQSLIVALLLLTENYHRIRNWMKDATVTPTGDVVRPSPRRTPRATRPESTKRRVRPPGQDPPGQGPSGPPGNVAA